VETHPTEVRVQWVIPASKADVAVVFARVRTEDTTWTHVLRWRLDTGEIEPGAWSTLRMTRHRCTLSADGRFLRYAAKDFGGRGYPRPEHPFNAGHAGGVAIARVPWLSALTDIDPVGAYGGGKSRHALTAQDQIALECICPPLTEQPWWRGQQPGWEKIEKESAAALAFPEVQRASDHGTVLVCRRGEGWRGLLATSARRIEYSGGSNQAVAYFLVREQEGRFVEVHPLAGLVWAWIDQSGRLLGATTEAELFVDSVNHRDGTRHRVSSHTLRDLTPLPGPSPEWARAQLSAAERNAG